MTPSIDQGHSSTKMVSQAPASQANVKRPASRGVSPSSRLPLKCGDKLAATEGPSQIFSAPAVQGPPSPIATKSTISSDVELLHSPAGSHASLVDRPELNEVVLEEPEPEPQDEERFVSASLAAEVMDEALNDLSTKLERRIKAQAAEIAALTREVNESKSRIEEQAEEITQQKCDYTALDKRYKSVDSALTASQADVQRLSVENGSQVAKLVAAQERFNGLDARHNILLKEQSTSNETIHSLKKRMTQKGISELAARTASDTLRDTKVDMQRAIDTKNEQLVGYEKWTCTLWKKVMSAEVRAMKAEALVADMRPWWENGVEETKALERRIERDGTQSECGGDGVEDTKSECGRDDEYQVVVAPSERRASF